MTRLIDKDDLISFLERVFPDNVIEGITSTTLFKQIIQDIRCQPIVMPKERSHGEWIKGREISKEMIYDKILHIDYENFTCSNCGLILDNLLYHVDGSPFYKYCPNCGADMKEADNDQ